VIERCLAKHPGDRYETECLTGEQARVFDLAGAADSALVHYSTFVQTGRWARLEEDAFLVAPALKRLRPV